MRRLWHLILKAEVPNCYSQFYSIPNVTKEDLAYFLASKYSILSIM